MKKDGKAGAVGGVDETLVVLEESGIGRSRAIKVI